MKKADAAVFKMNDDNYGIFSVDVLSPIVDDPEVFGRIVFANCISDICAMGGNPLIGLNIALFPGKVDVKQLSRILTGASNAALDNGVIIAGGHTAKDQEIKYGIAVFGTAIKNELMTADKAEIGDKIIVTKGIGTGIMFASLNNFGSDFMPSIKSMTQTNITPAKILKSHGCKCCTDITGFGLAVTLLEVLEESKKSATISASKIPLLSDVAEYSKTCACPVLGINLETAGDRMILDDDVEPHFVNILGDAQTSGGLIGFIKPDRVDSCLDELKKYGCNAAIIGEVTKGDSKLRITK